MNFDAGFSIYFDHRWGSMPSSRESLLIIRTTDYLEIHKECRLSLPGQSPRLTKIIGKELVNAAVKIPANVMTPPIHDRRAQLVTFAKAEITGATNKNI